jgi:malate dehydrogenase
MRKRIKLSLIGGGNVGGTLAFMAAIRGFADIVILDNRKDLAQAKALDIEESLPTVYRDTKILGTNHPENIRNSDVIVITAGTACDIDRKYDSFTISKNIIKDIAAKVKKYSPDGFVVIMTNPLDAMLYAFLNYSCLPRNKVIGMAGSLDTARYKLFLAKALNLSVSEVTALVVGEHGDTMVPLISYTAIAGFTIANLLANARISQNKPNYQ